MRIAFDSGKHHHAVAVTIFLIAVALVGAGATCEGDRTCQLTISSGSGGRVATPGEGTFPYPAGTVVHLVAVPDDGYKFRSWTGDIQHIANPNAASTTITMNGSYAIVANFAKEGETRPDEGGPIRP